MFFKSLTKYILLSGAVFLVSFAGSWITGGNVRNQTIMSLPPGGDDDKPAEQVYKNIQALNGMPAKDLGMVMQFMRSSLGVRCSFCHVHDDKTNKWNWESDDKDEKATARKMINMVKGINKDYFEGFSAVSCFTCHQGSNRISRIPPLPQVIAPPRKEGKDTTLPTAENIFEQYSKSLGDVSKIKNATSRYSKGSLTVWNGKVFDMEIYQQPANKYIQMVKTPDGIETECYDGTNGWAQDKSGVDDLEGFELQRMKEYADFTGDFDLSGRYTKTKVIGRDTVNGKTAYVVSAVIDDNRNERLYFDVDSGLLLRKKLYTRYIIGFIPEQADYSDYRSVNGIMIPFSVHYSYLDPGIETDIKYSEVKLNASLDNISFTKPQK